MEIPTSDSAVPILCSRGFVGSVESSVLTMINILSSPMERMRKGMTWLIMRVAYRYNISVITKTKIGNLDYVKKSGHMTL